MKASDPPLPNKGVWTDEDVQILKENLDKSNRELAFLLNRTIPAIQTARAKLKKGTLYGKKN